MMKFSYTRYLFIFLWLFSLFINASKIELEADTDLKSAYTKQQIILTIRLKSLSLVSNAHIDDIKIDNAIIEPLNELKNIETIENGASFYIYEQKYALFPLGDNDVSIPPITFYGSITEEKLFPGGFGFFSRSQRIELQSKPLNITIKPIPEDYPKGQPFLPLKSLSIIESFDDSNPDFKIGKATIRRFEIKADGTLASFLPNLQNPKINNLNIYAEKGQKVQKTGPNGFLTSLDISHVYIPSEPGDFQIPEQKIYWWNTEKNQLKVSTIRGFNFSVQGSKEVNIEPISKEPNIIIKEKEEKNNIFWPIISGIFFIFWLITLIMLYIKTRKKIIKISKENKSMTADALKEEIIHACAQNNIKEVYKLLIDLKQYYEDKNLNTYLWEIEKSLYKEHGNEPNLKNIADMVKRIENKNQSIKTLEPLYPN